MRGLRRVKRLQELRVVEVLIGSAVTDFFGSAAFVLGFWVTIEPNTTMCSFQGYLLQLFELSSIFWSVCVAIVVYQNVQSPAVGTANDEPARWNFFSRVYRKVIKKSHFHIVHFVVFAWLLPIVAAFIPLAEYNYSRFWCWISGRSHYFQFFCFYLWVILAFIMDAVIYISVCREKRHFKFSLYLVALMVVWTIPTLQRLSQLFVHPDNPASTELLDLHALTATWKGTLDFMLTLLIFFIKPNCLEGSCFCRQNDREAEALLSTN